MKYTALTDHLSCTFPLKDDDIEIMRFYLKFISIVGNEFTGFVNRNVGINGWERSYNIGNNGVIFAIGGQRGRAYLNIPGNACTLISQSSWKPFKELLSEEYDGKITRWDGAVDDYEGKHEFNFALKQYYSGGFNNGGNRPQLSQRGNWEFEDGKGKTLYIGNRDNGKYLRIYEKGKQLGDSNSKWIRWEIELRSKDRVIPWDGKWIPEADPNAGSKANELFGQKAGKW
ncbi:MAG: replication initiation factor domain-containing protein [Gammaproteobacteria bacterium]|nr:replication initiation factor domain-containing protein [Gammaproteobacteria bacterium]